MFPLPTTQATQHVPHGLETPPLEWGPQTAAWELELTADTVWPGPAPPAVPRVS